MLLIENNNLSGNTDDMCKHTITHFIADCADTSVGAFDSKLECSCCSLCCSEANVDSCNDDLWMGNLLGLWEFGYQRLMWRFDNDVVISSIPG